MKGSIAMKKTLIAGTAHTRDKSLALIARARDMLGAAHTPTDAKAVKDAGEAAIRLAKSRRDVGIEAIIEAQEIVRRAERMIGEMLRQPGAKAGKGRQSKCNALLHLGELGIDRMESSRFQRIASLPKDDFECWIQDSRMAGEELTQAAALRLASQHQAEERKSKRRRAMAEAAKVAHESDRPEFSLLNVDVLDGLQAVRDEHGPSRLIFTDPPYNIGIDYGNGEKADRLPDDEYMAWVSDWMGLCCDCLTDDGSLWVMIGDEYAADYHATLKFHGLTIRSWIKWYETFGVNCSNTFNRTSRHIFYAVKDPNSFVFDPEPVTRPSDRQTKYGDSRAAAGGKLWDDVWQIPRLTGTCAERIPDFPTQLPLSLVEPIVLCASMPGDLVVDPFNGSGTTGVAAVRNGRKYVGIEKSEVFADIATERLTGS
jgi:site-specific DNA-methyltransferase (adenine-specific)